uniref:C2H2-type domain-containing protein n=1 Tax=Ditylenchus dipsaci TaxID=166011 RepID=A0A915CTH5_9BILA
MLEEESTSCFGVDDNSVMDAIDSKDFFADFDLDEMSALEEGDLSLLSDPQKVRQLAEALSISPHANKSMQMNGSCSSSLPSDIFSHELSDKDGASFESQHSSNSPPINNNRHHRPSTTLENAAAVDGAGKNQQCACKDCGKLFNSVWYLKQHAVKHSNDRPFKCKFCMKTYKFRSNLYQHKCPERNRHMGGVGQSFKKKFYTRGIAYIEMYNGKAMDAEGNPIKFRPAKHRHKATGAEGGGSSGSGTTSAAAAPNGSSNYDINPFLNSQSQGAMNADNIFGNAQDGNRPAYPAQNAPMGSLNSFEMQSPRYPIMPNCQTQNNNNMFFEPSLLNNNNSNTDVDSEDKNSSMGSTNIANSLVPSQFEDPFCTPNPNYMASQFGLNGNFGLADYCSSIRQKPLDPDYIDNYIQKNRHRIYTCRKCKLSFPSREHLSRHNAYHTSLDCQPFVCDQCPQRFGNEKQLSGHYLQHSDNSPHRCAQCYGTFRSALALRRHKDQSRQCYCPPLECSPDW